MAPRLTSTREPGSACIYRHPIERVAIATIVLKTERNHPRSRMLIVPQDVIGATVKLQGGELIEIDRLNRLLSQNEVYCYYVTKKSPYNP